MEHALAKMIKVICPFSAEEYQQLKTESKQSKLAHDILGRIYFGTFHEILEPS